MMHKPVQLISTLSFSDWKNILAEVKKRIGENNVVIVSAGVAFFGFLAIFPAIMAHISVYWFVMDLQQIEEQVSEISSIISIRFREI
ncbi:hypothetical protein [Algoriphagus pacificus]|uniref:Uncharacterized protein n=1 Tax=Algoriphagus pacificus TaxID=2811234 RepID=A0ABS3CIL7_9BACT|nr:hypothetical protein [Algoriphagus pacificus]MBN7816943.1 hypothetical protein [Algoriphagus pacificus]